MVGTTVATDEITTRNSKQSNEGSRVANYLHPNGIVTLIKNRPDLLLVREAKPLKMNIATISEPSRFRSKCD